MQPNQPIKTKVLIESDNDELDPDISVDTPCPSNFHVPLDAETSRRSSISNPSQNSPSKQNIVFPKLKKVENSIIIINSTTEGVDIGKLPRVIPKIPVETGNENMTCDEPNPSISVDDEDNTPIPLPKYQSDPIPIDTSSDAASYKFVVPAPTCASIQPDIWKDLHSNRISNKNKEDILSPGWGDIISSCLAHTLPFCSLAFKT